MKSNISKYFNLIFSMILLILSFLNCWYLDELLDKLFIIPSLVLFIIFNMFFSKNLVSIFKEKNILM